MNYAVLSNEKNFTVFKYGNRIIRFKAPYSLEKYTEIKEWDHGYLVVMAKYKHNKESEEEYIDLIPILENLYISPEEFLKEIKVKIKNDWYYQSSLTETGSAKFFVKENGDTVLQNKGILNNREISKIQAFIKDNYKDMYLKWAKYSENGFYGEK